MNESDMDSYKIDSHKLIYHVSRVHEWLNNDLIYPIYVEVSPSGTCNHRCSFCAKDYMAYQKRYLEFPIFKKRLMEMGRLGIKSIMYAGEGEPLLHKNITEIIHCTKKAGIDVALATNGVLLRKPMLEEILENLEWIKVSINAGTAQTYASIHHTTAKDFDTVLNNLESAVNVRKLKGYRCTLGMQMVLLPENSEEAVPLAHIARDIGVDYLVIKPYSHHHKSRTKQYQHISYEKYAYLDNELAGFNSDKFNVIFRKKTMQKWDHSKRAYQKCLALPFWSYIDAGGNVWSCSSYLGEEKFSYGNLYQNSFQEIWEGSRKEELTGWLGQHLDTAQCRKNCRMDEINRYLWDLKYPPPHVNFI